MSYMILQFPEIVHLFGFSCVDYQLAAFKKIIYLSNTGAAKLATE